MSDPRVLLLHNRYRVHGGEERAVDLQLGALERAGMPCRALLRESDAAGRPAAALSLLGGGSHAAEVAAAVRSFGAGVVHAHNLQPLFGPSALHAAREAGARIVLTLHNFRLFCAIGVAFRDGETCFRCRGRLTLPGLVLNCRESLAESAVYAAGLAAHTPSVLAAADVFVTPSSFAAGQLARLGVPAERLRVLPNYLPAESFAASSRADSGTYALVAGRLAVEKGAATAIEAAALSGVPLRVAGEGPLEGELRAQAARLDAPVEFLGRVDRAGMTELLAGAAAVLVPSPGGDVFPFSALEAMAVGVPVVASRTGGLPEMVGPERCVPRGDAEAMADALRRLWDDPALRRTEGHALIARAGERFGEERYVAGLRALYAEA